MASKLLIKGIYTSRHIQLKKSFFINKYHQTVSEKYLGEEKVRLERDPALELNQGELNEAHQQKHGPQPPVGHSYAVFMQQGSRQISEQLRLLICTIACFVLRCRGLST